MISLISTFYAKDFHLLQTSGYYLMDNPIEEKEFRIKNLSRF